MKKTRVFGSVVILSAFSSSLLFLSCQHELPIPDTIPEICFESEVLPIFQNNCSMTGCHDVTGESGYVLNGFLGISHAVTSEKPYESPAYKAIISRSGESRMPPDKPLSLESRTIIRLWIIQGARLTSCPDTTSQPPGYVNLRACFQRDILPVLVSGCSMTGCHDAVSHQGDYSFTGYTATLQAVTLGDPLESKLYKVITAPSLGDRMPPSPASPLPASAIDSIRKWISYGALNEYCGEGCDTVNTVTFTAAIWPLVQTSCTGCHKGTAPGGGVLLENYSEVASVATSGLLLNALKGNGVPKMPPAGSLSTCRIRQFELWINNGSLNN